MFRIVSIHDPFDNPNLASAAAGALSRADAMGLLAQQVTCLDKAAIQALLAAVAEAGIGRNVVTVCGVFSGRTLINFLPIWKGSAKP